MNLSKQSPLVPDTEEPGETTGSSLAHQDHQRLDALERRMLAESAPVHAPVVHRFTPGLYTREIEMPPGMFLTSRIHRTRHPFAVLSGFALVHVAGGEPCLLEAGHLGITEANTRRVLFIGTVGENGRPVPAPTSCRWATFHPLAAEEEEARAAGASLDELLAMIEARVIEPHLHLDGTDAHREYVEGLAALGLPGKHDGPPALEDR